jgi:hypothetical protein
LHFPYQDNEAIECAINEGLKQGCDAIILNGDALDCHMISDFVKDPRKRKFKDELYSIRQFLASLRHTFPNANIYYKEGNHEERYWRYMRIKAPELFKNYFSWEALKRAVRNKEIVIEDIGEQLGYLTTKTLKPDPIPLQVKLILVGQPIYYHLLYEYDIDFKSLFKVKADFNSEMDRTIENSTNYISFFKGLAEKENMLIPDLESLKKLEEFGARFTEDQNKLSMRFGKIADVLREANHYANEDNSTSITTSHIEKAIEKRIYRSNLIAEKINEMIKKMINNMMNI